jgi:acyl carrier protein
LEVLFGVPVIDTYGMTEAATQIAANPLRRRKLGSVGRSAGAEIGILDREGRELSNGVRGEIALRGRTITRGYDNDEAATESAFRNGWFRTGDLGYLDEEGYLFIVGRIKDVIDRGGQKVAPAEVEEAFLNHPDVVEVAVFSVPHKRLGGDIAAAIVLRAGANPAAQKLRDFARQRLARFKVPRQIHFVSAIPKGTGGKIKRAELTALFQTTARIPRGGKVVSPSSELERQLAKLWADLLGLNQIGVDEDVFALGADSITVMQMISRLRDRFGVEFSFEDILTVPTVGALGTRIESWKKASTAPSLIVREETIDIARTQRNRPQPVSIMQEHLLRIERELPGLPHFNLPFAYRLQGPLNVSALRRSLVRVVCRHDSLRTRFAWMNQRPASLVIPAIDAKSCLIIKNLVPPPAASTQIKELLLRKAKLESEQEALKPFDMKHGPLFRARLFRLRADDHVLLLILHDIVVDGWSMGVFMQEVSQLYTALQTGRRLQLPEPAPQFSDFARWQRRWATGDAARRQVAYWKKRLRTASPVFAKNGRVGGALLATAIAQKRFRLSNDLIARLSTLSHRRCATLFMTLLTVFKTLLLARSERNDICVATAMANRSQLMTERMIGPLANTTLIRTQIDADLSFQEALNRVRSSVLEAYASQELPFDLLATQLAQDKNLDPASLIQFVFVLQNAFRRPSLKLPHVAIRPFGYWEGQPVMPIDCTWLTIILRETSSGINGTCRYKKNLLKPMTVQRWIADYKAMLAKVAENPKMSLRRLANVERTDRPANDINGRFPSR